MAIQKKTLRARDRISLDEGDWVQGFIDDGWRPVGAPTVETWDDGSRDGAEEWSMIIEREKTND